LNMSLIEKNIGETVPLSTTMKNEIRGLRLWAQQNARSASGTMRKPAAASQETVLGSLRFRQVFTFSDGKPLETFKEFVEGCRIHLGDDLQEALKTGRIERYLENNDLTALAQAAAKVKDDENTGAQTFLSAMETALGG